MPHRDQDMWRGPVGEIEYLVNVIWPPTEFRADNGATMMWPRSHGAQALAPELETEPVAAELAPGSAVVFLGSTLPGAGANRASDVRRGLVGGYSLGGFTPFVHLWIPSPAGRPG